MIENDKITIRKLKQPDSKLHFFRTSVQKFVLKFKIKNMLLSVEVSKLYPVLLRKTEYRNLNFTRAASGQWSKNVA